MERRIPTRLPDAINAYPDSDFTQIRNDMLRDPKISCKAKGILCILLSNQVNELISVNNLETLYSICREGYSSIQSGLIELKEAGYFTRVRYRDKKTKRIKGSFWICTDTPGKFNLEKYSQFFEENGWEVCPISK